MPFSYSVLIFLNTALQHVPVILKYAGSFAEGVPLCERRRAESYLYLLQCYPKWFCRNRDVLERKASKKLVCSVPSLENQDALLWRVTVEASNFSQQFFLNTHLGPLAPLLGIYYIEWGSVSLVLGVPGREREILECWYCCLWSSGMRKK